MCAFLQSSEKLRHTIHLYRDNQQLQPVSPVKIFFMANTTFCIIRHFIYISYSFFLALIYNNFPLLMLGTRSHNVCIAVSEFLLHFFLILIILNACDPYYHYHLYISFSVCSKTLIKKLEFVRALKNVPKTACDTQSSQ